MGIVRPFNDNNNNNNDNDIADCATLEDAYGPMCCMPDDVEEGPTVTDGEMAGGGNGGRQQRRRQATME